jgi:hypothetical protein
VLGAVTGLLIVWRKSHIFFNRIAWPFMVLGSPAMSLLRPDTVDAGWIGASIACFLGQSDS